MLPSDGLSKGLERYLEELIFYVGKVSAGSRNILF
jgi:hypothetical protein